MLGTIVLLVVASAGSEAKAECPPAVSVGVEKAFSGGKILSCKLETEEGHTQYNVRIKTKDGKNLGVDADKDGKILLTEEDLAPSAVPPAVMKSFAAKYPGAKAKATVKETKPDGTISYEIAFGSKNATFSQDGSFISEE
jgi:hypothetical protein